MTEATPDGLPIAVTFKVTSADTPLGEEAKEEDIIIEDTKKVTLLYSDDEEKSYDSDYVYLPDSSEKDIYARTSVPILNAFMDGVTGALLVFGAANTGRSDMLTGLGDGGGADDAMGLVKRMVEAVYTGLERKRKAMAERRHGELTFDMSVQYVELYDEVIQDLLNSQKRDLAIREDLVHGMQIAGATRAGPMMTADAVMEAYMAGNDARSREPTEFGPPDHYASAVFRLMLRQTVKQGQNKIGELVSFLTIADVAGAEKLGVRDPVALRATEGPRLNKSAFAFQACAAALTSGKEADYVPHNDSKLTLLLKEALGGNCLTSVIFCVAQNQRSISDATFKISRDMRQGVVFPVVNEVTTRGLIRKLRVATKQVRDELSELRYGTVTEEAKVKDGEADLLLKITELEGRAIRDNLEKLRIVDERDALQDKFKEIRTKYNELVESKAAAQTALIEAEEEKLRISKAILDLQIQNNQLGEMVDKEKFELGAKLMSAENDLVEVEMKRQQAVERGDQLHKAVEELSVEKREMAMELVTLKSNLVQRTRDLRSERAKNEDLGAEVLTLINQKRVLEESGGLASKEREDLERKAAMLNEQLETMRADYLLVKTKLKETLDTVDEANAARVKAELAAERARVDFEHRKLEVERSMHEYTSSMDGQVQKARVGASQEATALGREREGYQRQIANLEGTIRTQQRKIADLKADLAARTADLEAREDKNSSMEAQMHRDTDEYRERMLRHMAANDSDEARQAVIDDLVGTYRKREAEDTRKIGELRQEAHDMVAQIRTMKDEARNALYRVADLTGDVGEKAEAEAKARSLDSAEKTATAVEARLTRELDEARAQVDALRREVSQEKEKVLETAEAGRKQMQELRQQVADLEAKNKVLGDGGGGAAAEKKLADMQASMLKQMEELKKSQRRASRRSSSVAGGAGDAAAASEVAAVKEELEEVKAELEDARAEIKSLKKQLKAAQKAAEEAEAKAKAGAGEGGAGKKSRAPSREAAEPGSLLEQLRQSEEKAVQLLTRNTVLEEEATNYQKYMKTTIHKYQKEIAKLKKEVAMWKQKAGG